MSDPLSASGSSDAQPVVFGGFWWRVLAFLVDGIVIGGVSYFAVIGLGALGSLVAFFFFMIYSAGFEGSALRATPGKLAVRLRVGDVEGEPLTWGRSMARSLLKLVSAGSGGAGFAVAAFTPMKQAIHDLMASTVVVRRKKQE